MMYGQMTAGSWIYIGSQGIVQGTYETFVEMGRQHYGGDLGRWILTGARRHGRRAAAGRDHGRRLDAAVECQQSRIDLRLRTGYSTSRPRPRRGAGDASSSAKGEGERSVGLLGNAAECCPSWSARRAPGCVTDQTSPTIRSTATCRRAGRVAEWERRKSRSRRSSAAAKRRWRARRGDARLPRRMGVPTSTTATTSARWRWTRACQRLRLPRLRAGLHPPAVLPRRRPVPLGGAVGRSGGHLQDRRQGEGADPGRRHLHNWLDMARERIAFQGLPARICWVGLGDRHRLGPGLQRDGAQGRAEGAGRDRPRSPRLRLGGLAQPRDRSDADGSDAVSDWPLLNALLNTAGARPGCRCTTAAASAWASRSTPAWSSSATAREAARARSSACCGTIRRPA
jgi:urocanate hydratase